LKKGIQKDTVFMIFPAIPANPRDKFFSRRQVHVKQQPESAKNLILVSGQITGRYVDSNKAMESG
jgi:hypothetical protein